MIKDVVVRLIVEAVFQGKEAELLTKIKGVQD